MFEKIKHFFKKEKIMSTTGTDNRTTKQLKKQIAEQKEQLAQVRGRLSALRDDLSIVESNVNSFKADVAADMKRMLKTFVQKN